MRPRLSALGGAGMVLGAVMASAQGNEPGGLQMGVELDSRLVAADNLALDPVSAGSTIYWENRARLSIASETRLSSLRLSFGGVLRVGKAPGGGDITGLGEPTVSLAYSRTGSRASVSLTSDYSRRDLAFLNPLTDAATLASTTSLTPATGTRMTWTNGITVETGIDAPVGLLFSLTHDRTDYRDTTDPGLYDSARLTGEATAKLRFSQRTEGRVTVSAMDYQAEDVLRTRRRTQTLTLGMTQEINPTTRLDASLGVADLRTRYRATAIPESEDRGLVASVALDHDLPTGSIGLTLDTSLESTGRLTSAAVTRKMELPLGALSLSLGVIGVAQGGTYPTANITYTHKGPTGTLDLSLAQSVSATDENQDVRRLSAGLGYRHEITESSALALRVDYADLADAGGGSYAAQQRGTVSLTYSRDVSPGMAMDLGVQHDYQKTAVAGVASSNRIFLGLNRKIDLRP